MNTHRLWTSKIWTTALLVGACGSEPVPSQADADAAEVSDAGFDQDIVADTGVDIGVDPVLSEAGPVDASRDALADTAPLEWAESESCGTRDCGLGECDPIAGSCRCDSGTWFDGYTCVPTCADCGECPVIIAPVLQPLVGTETLSFVAGDAPIEIGTNRDLGAPEPETWTRSDAIELSEFVGTAVRVFARVDEPQCHHIRFSRVYDVVDSYPASAEEPGSDAVSAESARIRGWATEVIAYEAGAELFEEWMDPTQALGAAQGNAVEIVSLGEGGEITLGFESGIEDGLGPDFLLFENSFSDEFLEFAFVEVSSDGETFVRFDSASLTEDPVGRFGGIDPAGVGALPGRYRQGWGSPHDLGDLRQRPEVRSGALDLRHVVQVRLIDVVGHGTVFDSFGRPIYDPTPTYESAGFDLDAVGVLNPASP